MSKYHRHQHKKKVRASGKGVSKSMYYADRATFAVAILEPLMTIPQAAIIFQEHTAAGVSLSTWVGYEVLTLVWLWYGYIHKERMILVYQVLFLIMQTAVIVGGVMYGAKW